jgi:putative ABC transport system permease protein
MKWWFLISTALRSIMRNRMRSFLTMLGIIIGVCSVIVMVGMGKGAQRQIEEQIATLGTNVVIVRPGAARTGGVRLPPGSRQTLVVNDVERIASHREYFAGVSGIVRVGATVVAPRGNWQTNVFGVSTEYLYIRDWTVVAGDMFSQRDVMTSAKKALLGATVARELFGEQEPVGQRIRIRETPFEVIGVLEPKGQNAHGGDQDDMILAPYSTIMHRMSGSRYLDQIMIRVSDQVDIQYAQEELEIILRANHRLRPQEPNDFNLRTQTEIMERATAMSRTMTILLAAVAGVSLIVGGIGIMNIMLVTVTERTREIGIRMAIGARSKDILVQFLVESLVLSLMGGAIGVLAAFGTTWLLNDVFLVRTVMIPTTLLIAIGFSVAVGLFFGFYPARKASRMNPIEALRYE